jgi:hypothetical protein
MDFSPRSALNDENQKNPYDSFHFNLLTNTCGSLPEANDHLEVFSPLSANEEK